MNGLLSELSKSLAGRWIQYLVPAGLLYLAAAAAGALLGHASWYDLPRLVRYLDGLALHPGATSAGVVVLALVASLLAAMGCGLVVRAAGGAVQRVWGGAWPLRRVARGLTGWRRERWARAAARCDEAWRKAGRLAAAGDSAPGAAGEAVSALDVAREEAERLNAERNRIALAEPRRPTWMGDRLCAADLRVLSRYGLDLDSAWPRLWLIMPDTVRAELRTARDGYDEAARITAWALLYLLVGAWWWPAVVIAAVLAAVGIRRGRAAMDALCELAESTVDLYGRDLSTALGLDGGPGPIRPDHGKILREHLRKGA
ncbi:hypothetical protein [Microtetraspora malaysiensis]|uniref:hypothetical protein n=1 Tax=Microtetraspora malaysiensis TaxID=161358 RepID=UPI003D8EF9E9